MYNKKVMERFSNPKNAGTITSAEGVGQVGNVRCGDIMKIYLSIKKGVVTDAKFKTFGCVSAIASSDVACDIIKGKTVEEASKITNKEVVEVLDGLPAPKIHCSVLAKEAIDAALADYEKKLNKKKK